MSFFALLWRDDVRPAAAFTSRPLAIAPVAPTPSLLSVVVPVRDNGPGIRRLLNWWTQLPGADRPRELIIVDDGSEIPLSAEVSGCRILRDTGRGPAAARNRGWRAALSPWVAFIDSDCLPEPGWPDGFADGWEGEVAVQGRVRAAGVDALSRFYESQGTLRPMFWTSDGRPRYLITANALVWRGALESVDGFDESFRLAAGEDVDLGLRLSRLGTLRWSERACVAHDFEPSLRSFVSRFVRYGRGNRTLASRAIGVEEELAPRPFRAKSGRLVDDMLALLAFGALATGWVRESRVFQREFRAEHKEAELSPADTRGVTSEDSH